MAIVIEEKIQQSPPPPKNDGENESKAIEIGMAAEFGAMKESNRQTQEKLAQLEAERAAERAEREADRAEIRSAHQRIADLTAALEEEEEDLEAVEKVIPPKPEEKAKPEEKPKPVKTRFQKILFG